MTGCDYPHAMRGDNLGYSGCYASLSKLDVSSLKLRKDSYDYISS